MVAQILIQHGSKVYYPAVEEGITLELNRKGSPGKLKFNVIKDSVIDFTEGDSVKLDVDGTTMFYGFVFQKARSSGDPYKIEVTAYDQLRYFKNKDTYNFVNKTATQIIQMIANDYKLRLGTLENTEFVIASLPEDNTAMFDIVQDALDETLKAKTKLYVLYDDAGALTLKNIENMKLNLLIDPDTTGSYSYTSSIDTQTYNQIKITFKDSDKGGGSIYIAKDSSHINEWGLLQYTDTVESAAAGQAKADALLKLYNSKTRKLSVSDVLGDVRVRAGSSVVCKLNLGDIDVQSFLMVEQVTHTFKDSEHTMSMKLRGGTFVA